MYDWKQTLEDGLQGTLENIPEAREQVLRFILDFVTCSTATEEEYEALRSTFRAGYCWHFAQMMKAAFKRGEVCWAAPFGHIVWVDDNGVPYDVEGVYEGEAFYFIPESYLGDTVNDFIHVPDIGHNTTVEEIMDTIHRYEDDNGLSRQDEEILKYLK